jgi:N-acetylmuramoyl-L-alanine amidase
MIGGSTASASNLARKKQIAREQFEQAQKLREALDRIPEDQRTRRQYERVTEAYRRVYYTAPTSAKADEAVVGVAEMLTAIGRQFNDQRMLEAAIGQYDFLRKEYPGSKYRVNALFRMGQIYADDLNDSAKAKETFQEFLKHYPHAQLAPDVRRAIAEIDNPSLRKKRLVRERREKEQADADTPSARRSDAQSAARPEQADVSKSEERPESSDRGTESAEKHATTQYITGIRHWSTPDYTRVAIDLESEVKYEAGRIPSPDRIFFDLHDTKLPASLMGKTFDVEDGFLRKIRVAQYQRGMTRVVLDVADVSDYSAFLLPNPYRLIIDIHGKKPAKPQTLVARREAEKQTSEAEQATRRTEQAEKSRGPEVTITEGPARLPRQTAESVTPAQEIPRPKEEKRATQSAEKKTSDLDENLKKSEPGIKVEDATINVAKATQPELKATDKPTSSPTFESVAPRDVVTKKSPARRKREPAPEIAGHEARPTADGERSLIRALGLKIGKIVVDAGHGGHDTGTIGPNGLQEKDLVLDVALRLGKLLEKNLGADVVYTRSDDTFIPLETRTAIANQAQADLFISIHANSSRDPDARGVETYYLNFTSSPDALEVAARENAVSEKSIHELQDLVKKITMKEKIDESREFAADVQRSLYAGVAAKNPGIRNRGVKKAPFVVLIGANMPSILAEISFLSNPTDERRLQTPEYRQKIAEYLYKGIARYVNGLSGVKVATGRTPRPGRGSEGDR